jgi:hypothetical protein
MQRRVLKETYEATDDYGASIHTPDEVNQVVSQIFPRPLGEEYHQKYKRVPEPARLKEK